MKLKMWCAALGAVLAAQAHSATVDWRQGSGNSGQQFTVATGTVDFLNGTGELTLGLRAIQRNVGTITPVGSEYAAQTGQSSPGRAWWNFDIFAGLDSASAGFLSELASLTLSITVYGGGGASASLPLFDLLANPLRTNIDCHVIGCVNGAPFNMDATVADANGTGVNDGAASATADSNHFYNASQNSVFAPWFSGYNMNAAGFYDFTLTATDIDDNVIATSIRVNVGNYIPEPGSLALLAASLLAAAGTARRRVRQA